MTPDPSAARARIAELRARAKAVESYGPCPAESAWAEVRWLLALAEAALALRVAMEQVHGWKMPRPDYGSDYGSNGERDYIRTVASQALLAFDAAASGLDTKPAPEREEANGGA